MSWISITAIFGILIVFISQLCAFNRGYKAGYREGYKEAKLLEDHDERVN